MNTEGTKEESWLPLLISKKKKNYVNLIKFLCCLNNPKANISHNIKGNCVMMNPIGLSITRIHRQVGQPYPARRV